MSELSTCATCGATKSIRECELCHEGVCKACVQYLDTHYFSFLSKVPKELALGNYCHKCFDATVLPQKLQYEELMEKAKDIYFLTKAYPGHIHVLQKHTRRVTVEKCQDRRESILRLAFFAAELGFNAIIDSEVLATKVKMGGYQSSLWNGSAMPAKIDGEQLERASLRRI